MGDDDAKRKGNAEAYEERRGLTSLHSRYPHLSFVLLGIGRECENTEDNKGKRYTRYGRRPRIGLRVLS